MHIFAFFTFSEGSGLLVTSKSYLLLPRHKGMRCHKRLCVIEGPGGLHMEFRQSRLAGAPCPSERAAENAFCPPCYEHTCSNSWNGHTSEQECRILREASVDLLRS